MEININEKRRVLFAISLAFAFGFIAGSIVAHLTSKNRAEKSLIGLMTQSPPGEEPISIELTEKIEDLKDYLEVEPKGERANWVRGELRKLEMLNP